MSEDIGDHDTNEHTWSMEVGDPGQSCRLKRKLRVGRGRGRGTLPVGKGRQVELGIGNRCQGSDQRGARDAIEHQARTG